MAATKTLLVPYGTDTLGALSAANKARVLQVANDTRRVTLVGDAAFYVQVNSLADDDDAVTPTGAGWYGPIAAGVHYVVNLGPQIRRGSLRIAVSHDSLTPAVRYHAEDI